MTNKPARHTFFAGFVQVANLPQFYSNRVELSFLLRYNRDIFEFLCESLSDDLLNRQRRYNKTLILL